MLMLLTFSEERLELFNSSDVDTVLERIDRCCKTWLRCIELRERSTIARIAKFFGLKSSRVNLILNEFPTGIDEDLEDCLFNNYEVLARQTKHRELEVTRGSLVLGTNFLLTFETTESAILSTLIDNLAKGTLEVRQWGIDYLLYLIYKETLNNYYAVFDRIAKQLDELEDKVLEDSGDEFTYKKIAILRQSTRLGRRNLQTIKSLLAIVDYEHLQWIGQPVIALFERDLTHHLDSLLQEYQALRSWMSELMEIQRDNIASKTSQRIDRLTILSFIFLPITFIAGLYGMNFKYMPELNKPWAYPTVLGVMAFIAVGSLMYAKRKRWL